MWRFLLGSASVIVTATHAILLSRSEESGTRIDGLMTSYEFASILRLQSEAGIAWHMSHNNTADGSILTANGLPDDVQ